MNGKYSNDYFDLFTHSQPDTVHQRNSEAHTSVFMRHYNTRSVEWSRRLACSGPSWHGLMVLVFCNLESMLQYMRRSLLSEHRLFDVTNSAQQTNKLRICLSLLGAGLASSWTHKSAWTHKPTPFLSRF